MSARAKKKRVLVIDIGGTGLKLLATGQAERTKLPSSPDLTPAAMVKAVTTTTNEMMETE